jgi:hypothetical protein
MLKKPLIKYQPFMTKLNVIKFMCDKPVANIILNGEKLKVFPLKSGTKQRCLLSPLSFNTVLEARH